MEVNVAELEKSTKPHAAEYRIRKTQVCFLLKAFLTNRVFFSLFFS
jgi:hypothetical protein